MKIGSWPGALRSNPFITYLQSGLEKCGIEFVPIDEPSRHTSFNGDALLVQFPDQIFWRSRSVGKLFNRVYRELRALTEIKSRGTKLIWVVHNLVPHDLLFGRRLVWAALSYRLAGMVDGYMSLSPSTQSTIVRQHPRLAGLPYSYFWHPAYENVLVDQAVVQRHRRELSVRPGEILIGALGMIGAYKGTEDLISTFQKLKEDKYRLIVAGAPRQADIAARVKDLAGMDRRIICRLEQLSDDEFARTVGACDLLVAPYRNYLHSGSLVYAVSAHRRTLTPRKPFAEDLARVVGEGWILTYDGELNETKLRQALTTPVPIGPPDLSELEPFRVGERIRTFVHAIKARDGKTLISKTKGGRYARWMGLLHS